MRISIRLKSVLVTLFTLGMFPLVMLAQNADALTSVAAVPNPCTPRFSAGSVIAQPPALYSHNGVLSVNCPISRRPTHSVTCFTAS